MPTTLPLPWHLDGRPIRRPINPNSSLSFFRSVSSLSSDATTSTEVSSIFPSFVDESTALLGASRNDAKQGFGYRTRPTVKATTAPSEHDLRVACKSAISFIRVAELQGGVEAWSNRLTKGRTGLRSDSMSNKSGSGR